MPILSSILFVGYTLFDPCNNSNIETRFFHKEETTTRFLSPDHWQVGDHRNDRFN